MCGNGKERSDSGEHMEPKKKPFAWNIDPFEGSLIPPNGKQTEADDAQRRGLLDSGGWMDFSGIRQCLYTAGCVVLLCAVVIMSAFVAGLLICQSGR